MVQGTDLGNRSGGIEVQKRKCANGGRGGRIVLWAMGVDVHNPRLRLREAGNASLSGELA